MLGNLRVVGSAEFTERDDGILLADFKGQKRAVGHVLNEGQVFGQDSLVDFVELLDYWASQLEHFHRRDFKACIEDLVDDLSSKSFSEHVRLDEAKRAVVEHGSCLHWALQRILATEEKVDFTVVRTSLIGAVNGVLRADIDIAELRTDAPGVGLLGLHNVCGSNNFSPKLDCVFVDKLHANYGVTRHMLSQRSVERLACVFFIESTSSFAVEARHLKFVDFESSLENVINDFAHIVVRIRLDHSERALTVSLKASSRVHIAVVSHLKHARKNCHLRANVKVVQFDAWDLLLFQEHALVLDIEHLNRLGDGVVEHAVLADNARLSVMPVYFERELLFAKGQGGHLNLNL